MAPDITDIIREVSYEKGKWDGALWACRDNLMTLLHDRFGLAAEPLCQRAQATDDLKALQYAIRQVYRVQRLEELYL